MLQEQSQKQFFKHFPDAPVLMLWHFDKLTKKASFVAAIKSHTFSGVDGAKWFFLTCLIIEHPLLIARSTAALGYESCEAEDSEWGRSESQALNQSKWLVFNGSAFCKFIRSKRQHFTSPLRDRSWVFYAARECWGSFCLLVSKFRIIITTWRKLVQRANRGKQNILRKQNH